MSFIQTKTAKEIVREGSFDAVKIGAAETYLSAFGVYLGASPFQLGTLSTLPPLVGAFAQTIGMRLAERVPSRRGIIVKCIYLQASLCALFGIVGLPFLADNLSKSAIFSVLIALASLYHITIGLIAPLWTSLVGDLVPPAQRGEFFGYRNRWMSVFTFAGVVLAGEAIHLLAGFGYAALAYACVFLVAGLSRALSGGRMLKVSDPQLDFPAGSSFSFLRFILRARQSNFVRFVLFVSAMNFATAIAGPYFTMYMLNDLKFSYREYMIVIAAVVLAQFVVMRSWGVLSDQFGNRKILMVCGILVTTNPFLWLVSANFYWIIFVQLYSGMFWAGFNLAAANFVFDAVTSPKRARCFAYQSIINGALVFIGSILGGWLVWVIPDAVHRLCGILVGESRFLAIFLLSGFLRGVVMLVLYPMFREVRSVKRVRGYQVLLRVVSLRPLWGVAFGLSWGRRGRGD